MSEQRWEYWVHQFTSENSWVDAEFLSSDLADAAAAGWELYKIIRNRQQCLFIFRRRPEAKEDRV